MRGFQESCVEESEHSQKLAIGDQTGHLEISYAVITVTKHM